MRRGEPAYVLLEDGAWFPGTTRRPLSATAGEVVFTTNMSGYQEVFTDPSYLGQIVVMTAPMIGNYGVNGEDFESDRPQVTGVVVRELAAAYSNWRANGPLDGWLAASNVPILEGVDTRRLARHIRSAGAMRGVVALGVEPTDGAREQVAASPSMVGLDLASRATVVDEQVHGDADARHHVVAYDFGMKRNIVRILMGHGCRVTIVPAQTRRTRAGARARWCVPVEWSGRSGGSPIRPSRHTRNCRIGDADLRYLSWSPVAGARVRRGDCEAAIRSSGRESPGEGPGVWPGPDHQPESRICSQGKQ